MSYEDEVMPAPRYPRERRAHVYAGPAPSTSTHEARKRCCKSAQEEERVFADEAGR